MFENLGSKARALMALGIVLAAVVAAAISPAASAMAAGLPGGAGRIQANHAGNGNLKVTLSYGLVGDTLTISGNNIPAGQGVKLALLFSHGQMVNLRGWKANSYGSFDVSRDIATYPAGTTFRVVAFGANGFKEVSAVVTVGR